MEVKHPFTFELDNFQKLAISAIAKHENVLVTAKTGSGKTLVGEYQIYASLQKGKRVFYTTPIKSLSNQKFHDLKKIYGDKIGIITGDIKFNPLGDILIMTTEILRNLLYKHQTSTENLGTTAGISLEGLDAVVFDEVHYINDPERGKVWEETLIMLPTDVNLVLLSATIDKPEAFADWLRQLKQKPIHCISTNYRIIPLHHYVIDFTDITSIKLVEIMNFKNQFDTETYKHWLRQGLNKQKAYDEFKEKVKQREEDQVVKEGKVHLYNYQHTMNETIEMLRVKNLLPALFFVFSRAGCEKFAHNVQGSLIDSSDAAAVKHIISFHLHRHMDKLEHLTQYHKLHDLLCRGVAFHHSGMLPILKEIVEILFNKGFIKVLFATETFAVGINMPTKTVVFTDLRKFDDKYDDMRILRTDEYLQMAGRAGRRGIDTSGTVIYLPMKKPESLENIRSMMTGKTCSIESKLKIDFDMILKSLHSGKNNYEQTYENSYLKFQESQEEELLTQEIKFLEEERNKLQIDPYLEDLKYRKSLDADKTSSLPEKRKLAQTAINMWNNKHMGPKWASILKSYETYCKLSKDIENREVEIIKMKSQKQIVQNEQLQFLEKYKFIELSLNLGLNNPEFKPEAKITQKGILATEINQMHCILFTEAYTQKLLYLEDISFQELAALVSCFEVFNSNDKDIRLELPTGHLGYAFRNLEILKKDMQLEDVYLTHNWCYPILDWMEGQEVEAICSNYGLFPGNLVKTVLSIINALDELIVLGTLTSNINLLEKATEAKKIIQRNVTVADSLYLRL